MFDARSISDRISSSSKTRISIRNIIFVKTHFQLKWQTLSVKDLQHCQVGIS